MGAKSPDFACAIKAFIFRVEGDVSNVASIERIRAAHAKSGDFTPMRYAHRNRIIPRLAFSISRLGFFTPCLALLAGFASLPSLLMFLQFGRMGETMYFCGDKHYIQAMRYTEERYISLLTDFGFKRIFGTKPNKDLLINFLNSLFEGFQVITDVKYLNSEHVGDVFAERKAIFDVYCENERGEKFIVEMQNTFQKFFKDRSLFYSTFPIREQAQKGTDWNFELKHVYTVALLNFDLQEDAFDAADINHDVGLLDKKTHKVFNDKLSFKYVEIAKFNKTEDQLVTLYDKWLYVLKNISRLDRQPAALKEKVFAKLFEEAEIAKFTPTELREYEDSLKAYRDLKNSIDTALEQGREQGREEGLEEGRAEGLAKGRAEGLEEGLAKGHANGLAEGEKKAKKQMALNLLSLGIPDKTIAQASGLTEDEIENLRKDLP